MSTREQGRERWVIMINIIQHAQWPVIYSLLKRRFIHDARSLSSDLKTD